MKALKARTWISVMLSIAVLLTGCGGGGSSGGSTTPGGGGGGSTNVTVPNVVESTQASATTAITAAGLTLGTVAKASSSTIASGNVISQSPAAGASVASGSAVGITVSTGPATVAVPNVVGMTEAAATTSIKGAGLVVGTVTMSSSGTVAAGSVISESPTAGTTVATGSAVNLNVSTGAAPGNHFAYVANSADATISMYSVSATNGALTALANSPLALPTGAKQLSEIKIDPSHQFLYVISEGSDEVYAYVISATTGALTAVTGSPFATGQQPQSMVFDATGAYLYVSNIKDNSVSGFLLNGTTGALTQNGPALKLTTGTNPAQLARAGNFLYVTYQGNNFVEVLPIDTTTGALSLGTADGTSPYQTDVGPYSIAIDPAGTVLYTANAGAGTGSISSFQIDLATGDLTQFTSGLSIAIPANSDIGIDPHGKFLFVTERNLNGVLDVYPIDAASPTGLDAAVAGSPFSTGGNTPNSVSFDPSGQFVYTGNDSSANVAVFTLASTGVLTAVGSPVMAGNNPDFIAIY
jgi:6-phosphogluconolactonase